MNGTVESVLLVVVAILLVWLALSHLRYRLTHPFSQEDLEDARKDATKRSRSVLGGKAGEQLASLAPEFREAFDPRDARFLGTPIDYVIFDRLGSERLRRIVFVEVKTGPAAKLSASEREVRRAVDEGRIEFRLLNLR